MSGVTGTGLGRGVDRLLHRLRFVGDPWRQSPEAGFWQLVAAPRPLGSLSLAGGHPGEAHRQAWRTARVGGTARDCLKGGSRALLSQDTP